jgi:hypothetical protein
MPQRVTETLTLTVGKPLLQPGDFTYLGHYVVGGSVGNGLCYASGLALRRVSGQLRFLSLAWGSGGGAGGNYPVEWVLPAGGFGQTITTRINAWNGFWGASYPSSPDYGIWWEDQGNGNDGIGRMWSTQAIDYPSDSQLNYQHAVAVRTLNNDGPPSNSSIGNYVGPQGFDGIGQRAIYGGISKIPASWRAKYGVSQPYAVGWGGYTSRLSQGLTPSMGLMVVAVPDVTTYPNPTEGIPATDFKILADHRGGASGKDWYTTPGNPSAFDRGQRNPNVVNYFDGGQTGGQTPPAPPASGAQWLSPAPDGFGRMVWGDSYWNTGCWIEGPNKQGFLAVLTCAHGNAWYAGSTLHNDSRDAELQIFDPDDFGKVLQGGKQPWNVQPSASKLLTPDLSPLGLLWGAGGNIPAGGVAGAAVDPTTGILWLWCPQIHGSTSNVLAAYQINW